MNKLSEEMLKGKCSVCGQVFEYPYADRVNVLLFDHWRKYHPRELCDSNINREMLAVRMEIAVSICTKHPTLYKRMEHDNLVYFSEEEMVACKILDNLMMLEPVIGKVLELYYK